MTSSRVRDLFAGTLFAAVLLIVGARALELVDPGTAASATAAVALLGIAGSLLLARLRRRPAAVARDLLGRALLRTDSLACYTLDRNARVGTWNRGAQALFGWSAGEMEGRSLSGRLLTAPQEGELLAEVQRLCETGRAHAPRVSSVTSREGRTFETVSVMVPLVARRRVFGVAVIHLDPHSPQLVEGRWSRLFHAAPAGLLRIDGAGRIEAVNRRFTEWTGRTTGALEGTEVGRSEIFPEEFRERLHEAARGSKEGDAAKAPFECAVTLVGAEGTPRPYVAIVAPRPGSGADVALVDGTSRERLSVERDLARAAAEAARESASETVSTHRDLTSSVEQLMSALESARGSDSEPERRTPAEREVARSGRILLANIERIEEVRRGRGDGPTEVLLVEDNDANRELIAHMLISRGARVTHVASGREALEAVARDWFDVVLLDLQMPEMDGYEVVRRIRALPGGEAITVVALTALGAEGIRERCLAEGMDDFVSKPLTLAKVSEILSRWGRSAEPSRG